MTEPRDDERQDDDWEQRIVRLASAVGMNPVRVRWKLQRLRNRWQAWRRRSEQRTEHVRYAHKVCPGCRAVQDRDEKVCTSCGQRLRSRRWQMLGRLGFRAPDMISMSGVLGALVVLVYGRLILASGGEGLLALDVELLYRFGGRWMPDIQDGQVWRLATAVFLHAGMWHLGFNMIALTVIGPLVEGAFGRWAMLFAFVITGALANLGSGLVGDPAVGIGASGGLMGLLGMAAGSGQREGSARGIALRNDMLKWAAYVMVFGFLIGADNWAHAFGAVVGAAIGFSVRPVWLTKPVNVVLGVLGAVATIACVAWILMGPHDPAPTAQPVDDAELARTYLAAGDRACAELSAGDADSARRTMRDVLAADSVSDVDLDSLLASLCADLKVARTRCAWLDVDPSEVPELAALTPEQRAPILERIHDDCRLLREATGR